MKTVITILTIFSLAVWGFSATAQDNGTKENWQRISTEDYEMQYPEGWSLDDSGHMGTSFVIYCPPNKAEVQFRANINLLIQDNSEKQLNLEEYAATSEKQILSLIKECRIISSEKVKSKNDNYHRIIFTGNQLKLNLQFEQRYWIIGDNVYILTFTCDEEQLDKFEAIGQEIMNGFQFN